MLKTGEILQNRYRIINRLGEGGMGTVYQAEDLKRFNKAVALKEILIDLTDKNPEHFRRAFEREAKILTQIEHEAVPKVVDYFLETDCQFLVMELIEGEDLTSILQKRRTWFPLENVLNWTNQLLDALDYLHTLKPPIIHRDIKPQNLKLTARGKIKLLDFGIAKDTGAEFSATMTDHTFIGATLHYSPFEQLIRIPFYYEPLNMLYGEKVQYVMRQSADARSDIYSLGATLYHLLTNVEPTGAYQRTLEIWAGKFDPLPPPHKVVSHLSPQISAFLLKAMELERDNRYSSALEMKTALQELIWEEKKRDYEEDQAILIAEHERLSVEREEFEAERQRLKAEKEETLRQLAAERERFRIEKEEREREQKLFEVERKQFETQERERLRLEQEEKKQIEIKRLEAEHQEALLEIKFERERQRLQERELERARRWLEEESKERERLRLEEEVKKAWEREELEAGRRQLEAEKQLLKLQMEGERYQIEVERQQLEAERQKLEEEKNRKQKSLRGQTQKEGRLEAERKRLEEEEADTLREMQAAFVTQKVNLAETDLSAEQTIEAAVAQISPFATRTDIKDFVKAEKPEEIEVESAEQERKRNPKTRKSFTK